MRWKVWKGKGQQLYFTLSDCRLAKIRGLMYRGKYSAVIGQKTRFFVCAQHEYAGYGYFQANHSAVFVPVHQTTDFRQTTG